MIFDIKLKLAIFFSWILLDSFLFFFDIQGLKIQYSKKSFKNLSANL